MKVSGNVSHQQSFSAANCTAGRIYMAKGSYYIRTNGGMVELSPVPRVISFYTLKNDVTFTPLSAGETVTLTQE